jgi:hypothetical protein
MNATRRSSLISIVVATLIAGITSVYGLALFESWILESTERTLKLAGQRLVHKVDNVRAEVETTAAKFARSSKLNASFMTLDDLLYDQRERPWTSKKLQPKVDTQRDLLTKQVELALGKTPDLRLAYVDLDSRVLLNRGTDLAVNKVYDPKKVKGLPKGLQGKSDFSWLREGPRLIARNVMPFNDRYGQLAGILVVEKALSLDNSLLSGFDYVVVDGDIMVAGVKPGLFRPDPKPTPNLMSVIAPGNADAYILGLGRMPLQPLLVDLDKVGVVGVEVSLPDLDSNFRAWVYDDVSVAFAQLGGAQYTFLILLLFVAGLSIAAIVNNDNADPSLGLTDLHDFAQELETSEDALKLPGSLRGQVKLREIAETLLKFREASVASGRSLAAEQGENSPSYVAAFPNPKDREKVDFAALDVDGFLGATRISADSLAFTPLEGVASQGAAHSPSASAPRTGMVTTPLQASPQSFDTITGFVADIDRAQLASGATTPSGIDSGGWDLLEGPELSEDKSASASNQFAISESPDHSSTSIMEVDPSLMKDLQAKDPELAAAPPPMPSDAEPAPTMVFSSIDEMIGSASSQNLQAPPVTAPPIVVSSGVTTSERLNSLEADYRRTYDDFVALRAQCGENGSVRWEKFRQRLEESRRKVIEKHRCRDVSFQVYVKNGKAALKASPKNS